MSAAAQTISSRLVVQFERFLAREAARWVRPAAAILHAEGMKAALVYELAGNEAAALASVEELPWRRYIERVWLGTAPRAGDMVAEALNPAKATRQDPFMSETVRYLRLNAGERITGITDTSRDEIGNQIRIGVSKGESRRQIAARIVKHRRSITPERAKLIARTEVHAAANYGSLQAAEIVAVPLVKIWVSRLGARASHAAAGGQRRTLDAAFDVGGWPMAFPGDGSMGAPAGEICNCRCICSFEIARRPAGRRRAA